MYEFGCFVVWWGQFEMLMEVAIWKLTQRNAKANCLKINKLTAGRKRELLVKLLRRHAEAIKEALDRVFNVAKRNDWVHGTILNPNGDFSRLTRLRVHRESSRVENEPVDFSLSTFGQFFRSLEQFKTALANTIGVYVGSADAYIREMQGANPVVSTPRTDPVVCPRNGSTSPGCGRPDRRTVDSSGAD